MNPTLTQATRDAIASVLRREGGYVDTPDDKGGPTNHGITIQTLSTVRGTKCTADDVKALTPEGAEAIYTDLWVRRSDCNYDALPPKIQEAVLDTAVLCGQKQANRWLQEIVGAAPDGIIGVDTRRRCEAMDPYTITQALAAKRIAHHTERCEEDPTQRKFLKGWKNRANEIGETGR
jgi:lysozyme family protein